jgi:hypothetical protein
MIDCAQDGRPVHGRLRGVQLAAWQRDKVLGEAIRSAWRRGLRRRVRRVGAHGALDAVAAHWRLSGVHCD